MRAGWDTEPEGGDDVVDDGPRHKMMNTVRHEPHQRAVESVLTIGVHRCSSGTCPSGQAHRMLATGEGVSGGLPLHPALHSVRVVKGICRDAVKRMDLAGKHMAVELWAAMSCSSQRPSPPPAPRIPLSFGGVLMES